MSATGDIIDRVERENSDLRRRIAQLEADLERAKAENADLYRRVKNLHDNWDLASIRTNGRLEVLEADLREANIRADYYLDKLNAIVDCREIGGDTPERQVEFCVSVAESATNAFPPKEGE